MPSGRNRQYNNGAAFERRVKARLEQEGWTVFRTAGSHSPADLIAMKSIRLVPKGLGGLTPILRLVQCKGGTTTLGPKARSEFYAFAAGLGAEAWIAERGMKLTKLEAQ